MIASCRGRSSPRHTHVIYHYVDGVPALGWRLREATIAIIHVITVRDNRFYNRMLQRLAWSAEGTCAMAAPLVVMYAHCK